MNNAEIIQVLINRETQLKKAVEQQDEIYSAAGISMWKPKDIFDRLDEIRYLKNKFTELNS